MAKTEHFPAKPSVNPPGEKLYSFGNWGNNARDDNAEKDMVSIPRVKECPDCFGMVRKTIKIPSQYLLPKKHLKSLKRVVLTQLLLFIFGVYKRCTPF